MTKESMAAIKLKTELKNSIATTLADMVADSTTKLIAQYQQGQITADEFLDIYHKRALDSYEAIYQQKGAKK